MMKAFRESKGLPYDEMPNNAMQFTDDDLYVYLSDSPYVYEGHTVFGFLRHGKGNQRFLTTEVAKHLYDRLKSALTPSTPPTP